MDVSYQAILVCRWVNLCGCVSWCLSSNLQTDRSSRERSYGSLCGTIFVSIAASVIIAIIVVYVTIIIATVVDIVAIVTP